MKWRALGFALAVAAVLLFPRAAGTYPVRLLQEITIFGIFAMSLDLLRGFAGMVSFGHSAFCGVGGYVAALALTRWGADGVNGLVLPAVAAALAALVIGYFSIRVSGVYFIMLTLAFSQMFYALTFQVAWLGAEDGLVGVPRPRILGVDLYRAVHSAIADVLVHPEPRVCALEHKPNPSALAGPVAVVH